MARLVVEHNVVVKSTLASPTLMEVHPQAYICLHLFHYHSYQLGEGKTELCQVSYFLQTSGVVRVVTSLYKAFHETVLLLCSWYKKIVLDKCLTLYSISSFLGNVQILLLDLGLTWCK